MSNLPSFKSIQLQWLNRLCTDTDISDNAMRVAAFIALKYVNGDTGTAWPSFQTLAKGLGKSVKTIQRAIRELELADWFTVKRGNGLSHNTVYKPSDASIITASEHKEKPVKSDTLCDKDEPKTVTNMTSKGSQICPPNLEIEINNIPPPKSPSPAVETAKEERDYEFSNLWEKWPVNIRPRSRELTERLFKALSKENQAKAISFASSYCLNMNLKKEACLLIPYLKNKLFLAFVDAPPLDEEGYFKITPQRQEWAIWLEDIQQRFGEKSLERIRNLGYYLVKTKLPA